MCSYSRSSRHRPFVVPSPPTHPRRLPAADPPDPPSAAAPAGTSGRDSCRSTIWAGSASSSTRSPPSWNLRVGRRAGGCPLSDPATPVQFGRASDPFGGAEAGFARRRRRRAGWRRSPADHATGRRGCRPRRRGSLATPSRRVHGMSMCRTPRWARASMTAFWTAGVEPMVAASPMPFAPSGLRGVGVSVSSDLEARASPSRLACRSRRGCDVSRLPSSS